MEGRPFALLGVNCDRERETIQQASFTQQITWPNWWNGESASGFTALYGVKSFPTTVVLDAKGVVRYRGMPGPQMDAVVEKLVQEAEGKRG
jgi:hypothetical protein